MSNTHNSYPIPLTLDSRSGQSLAALACKVVESGTHGSAYARLRAEIDNLLAVRKDGAFEAAYSMIDDAAVRAELESCIEDTSQIVELFVGWDGADPRPSEAMLFAIPVILGILPGEDAPSEIPRMDQWVESFRRHGLVGPHPAVYLASEFLRLPDVDVPPSRRRLLLQSLVTRYFGGNFGALPGSRGAGRGELNVLESGFPRLSLGFLVGAVMSSLETEERPFYPDEAKADEYDDRCRSWSDEASAWLEEQTGYGFALALPPEILSDAIKTGIDEYRATALEITAKTAALASTGGPAQCRAEVALTGAGEPKAGVRIAVHDGGFVNEYFWPWWSFDDETTTIEWILGILEREGVVSIETFRSGEPDGLKIRGR
jgi:hypothetical protein